jgi:heme a synthase
MNPVSQANRLANWLLGVAILVFAIIVVGGITRLTESGLSITEWKPVTGALPPLSEADWQAAFARYQQIPEYQLINKGMSLADFKAIFFWEWLHRLLGRLIGLALLLPFFWFFVTRTIPKGYALRLFALAALVGFQGALGWWMVASGLTVRTDVSHFRLAAHLLTALFLLAGLVWTALDLKALARNPAARAARLTTVTVATFAILFIQLLLGAWTAGLNAGQVTTFWPLMDEKNFLPEDIGWSRGVLWAISNDPFLIHFMHRWWAWVTVLALIVLARRVKLSGPRAASIAIHASFGVQIVLGIATVWFGVPIILAVLHQAVGALVVASAAWGAHVLGRQSLSVS